MQGGAEVTDSDMLWASALLHSYSVSVLCKTPAHWYVSIEIEHEKLIVKLKGEVF